MSGLVLNNIAAGYGGRKIVRNIDIEIRNGEFCALLGRNGSGKTTLVKAVCGLIPVMSGQTVANGVDCTRLNEYKRARHISYVPQRHSKMQGVTVIDAVLMGYNPHLSLLGSPDQADIKRTEDILAQMGLEALSGHDFARISEGQKQLAILSRALVQNAPVMLMDEPDSALDFPNRHMVLQRIRELIHKSGKAGLITLHDPNFALEYCDSIVLIEDGEIMGRLKLAEATSVEVCTQLSRIYGDIAILEHNGRFFITMK